MRVFVCVRVCARVFVCVRVCANVRLRECIKLIGPFTSVRIQRIVFETKSIVCALFYIVSFRLFKYNKFVFT